MRRWGRSLGALTVGLGMLAASAGCSSGDQGTPAPGGGNDGSTGGPAPTAEPGHRGGTLRLGVTGLDSLDPEDVVPSQASEMMAVDLLYESLTSIDPTTQEAGPGLAASWTSNPELTEWTFTLRDGITFSDGSPVTATDVKFTLDRAAGKGAQTLAGARLEIVDGFAEAADGTAGDLRGVQVVDARTVKIVTRVPYAPLPELLASPLYGVVPQGQVSSDPDGFTLNPVGSGAYMLGPGMSGPGGENESLAGAPGGGLGTISLVRAPGPLGQEANLDGVDLVRFAEDPASYQAFMDGTVDWALVPPEQTDAAAKAYGTDHFRPFAFTRFFAFNLQNLAYRVEPFRKAIIHGIDRPAIVQDVLKSPLPMNGVVPPSVPGGQADPCGGACAYDVEAGKAALNEAVPGGGPPPVEFQYFTDPTDPDKGLEGAANAMAADVVDIGLTGTAVAKPFEEYRSFIVSGRQQMFAYGWWGIMPDPDAYLAPLFASGSPDNVTGFADPAFDAALADARATADRPARLEKYKALEESVMARVPIIPLAQFELDAVVGTRVQAFETRLDGTFDVSAVWISG